MKKVTALILCAILALSGFCVCAYAEDDNTDLSYEDLTYAPPDITTTEDTGVEDFISENFGEVIDENRDSVIDGMNIIQSLLEKLRNFFAMIVATLNAISEKFFSQPSDGTGLFAFLYK